MRRLNPDERKALADVASRLVVDPVHLAAEIQFESGWNPLIQNLGGSSGRGLIQFMDFTARDMGYYGGSAQLVALFPDAARQLRGPVLTYLKRYAPFPTDQSLFMAVFYPAARAWEPTQRFPEKVIKANSTKKYSITCPKDYCDKVWAEVGEITKEDVAPDVEVTA